MSLLLCRYCCAVWPCWALGAKQRLQRRPPPPDTCLRPTKPSFVIQQHPPPRPSCRDLTINSLFYNINTGTLEDYTGKGTSDLRLGLVRTPLPPCETLLDDPLRVLRAVRFASRLGFRVHPELMDAGRNPGVHEALCTKVGDGGRREGSRGGGWGVVRKMCLIFIVPTGTR